MTEDRFIHISTALRSPLIGLIVAVGMWVNRPGVAKKVIAPVLR
jgi:hypothetical protein